MANILKPSKLNLLWASGGDILDPGDTKYQTGWGVEVPPRQWENYIQNKQDQAIAHINQHGIAVWDAETEYQAGTSYTQGQTNGTIYRAKLTHSGQNPELDTLNTYWDIAFAAAGDFYTKAEVDAEFLAKDQNLGDLPSVTDARSNLSVYSKAETYTKVEVNNRTTIASAAQMETLDSNTVLVSPQRLKDSFTMSGIYSQNGFQQLPGGLIIQWGRTATIAIGGSVNVTFPTPFSSNVFVLTSGLNIPNTTADGTCSFGVPSLTGVTIYGDSNGSLTNGVSWIAIGV